MKFVYDIDFYCQDDKDGIGQAFWLIKYFLFVINMAIIFCLEYKQHVRESTLRFTHVFC